MSTTPLPMTVVDALEAALRLLEEALDAVLRQPTPRVLERLLDAARMVVDAGRAVIKHARGAA